METFDHVQKQGMGWFDERQKGDVLAILNDDIIQNESCWSILTFLIIGNFLKNKALFTLLTEIGWESCARCQFDLERIKKEEEWQIIGKN